MESVYVKSASVLSLTLASALFISACAGHPANPMAVVQIGDEVAPMLVVSRPEARKLKHQQPYMRSNRLARTKECPLKQFSIEETVVGFSGQITKARQLWELLYRDCIGHLEAKQEIIRDLECHPLQILLTGESVVSRINANSLEHLCILSQAVLFEAAFSELAPPFITGTVIEHLAPSRIFPRGCAHVNPLDGQRGRLLRH